SPYQRDHAAASSQLILTARKLTKMVSLLGRSLPPNTANRLQRYQAQQRAAAGIISSVIVTGYAAVSASLPPESISGLKVAALSCLRPSAYSIRMVLGRAISGTHR